MKRAKPAKGASRSNDWLDLSGLRMATGSFAHASVAIGQPIRAARRRLD